MVENTVPRLNCCVKIFACEIDPKPTPINKLALLIFILFRIWAKNGSVIGTSALSELDPDSSQIWVYEAQVGSANAWEKNGRPVVIEVAGETSSVLITLLRSLPCTAVLADLTK